MYSKLPAFVLGFHGCDISTKEAVLYDGKELEPSHNKYDWLGGGIYFWEQNPKRALAFAQKAKDNPHKYSHNIIEEPAVIGAVIDLGVCLNLMDMYHIERLKAAYELLNQIVIKNGTKLPVNRGWVEGDDKPGRMLDCAVIETLHHHIERHPELKIPQYDSVRGLFQEGKELYPGAGFREETHIQLCVRNRNCIKGYFDPREELAAPYIV